MSGAATALLPAAGLKAYLADLQRTLGGPRLMAVAALMLGASALDGAGLLLLVPILQLVDGQGTTPALRWLGAHGVHPRLDVMLALFLALVLVRAAAARGREKQVLMLRLDYVDALRRRAQAGLAASSWQWLARLDHAHVLHLLTEQLARVNLGTHQLLQLASGAGLGLAAVAVAAAVSPLWTALLLLPLLAMVWLMRARLARVAALGQDLGRGQRAALASMRGFLAGLKMVKAHGAEDRHLAEFEHLAGQLHREQMRFNHHQAVTRGWFEAGGATLLAAVLYGAATWGRLGLPELLLIVFVCSRLLPIVREGQLQAQHLAHMLPAWWDLQTLVAECRDHGEPQPDAALPPLPLRQALQLEAVSFRHAGSPALALDALTLTLQAGTTTVLSGPSGAGKTTLADMAAGLLAPASGCLRVDGVALRDAAALRHWRRSVAYVGQEAYLFPGSVRHNLCWLTGPLPDAALWQCLERADAAAFVRALPGGLDQPLGERGDGLSGGERQRLALARALLPQPALLIVDEVTSQLDADSEARVLAALDGLRGQVTILAVAHRRAVLRHADRVITLACGRLVADEAVFRQPPAAPVSSTA